MSINENIKKYRKEKGLTQSELGEMIGKSLRMIQKYEADKNNKTSVEPSLDILKKIADALEVSINDLIDPMTASKDLLMDSLKQDEDKIKEIQKKQDLLDNEIVKRLSLLNNKGKLEAFKRIDDLRFRIEYRKDQGFSTYLPQDDTFDNWLVKFDELDKDISPSDKPLYKVEYFEEEK